MVGAAAKRPLGAEVAQLGGRRRPPKGGDILPAFSFKMPPHQEDVDDGDQYPSGNLLPAIPRPHVPRSVAEFQLPGKIQDKILGPPRRCDNPVGEGFLQFGVRCAGFLRAREVLLQSGGAPHRHGAADPDQLPGPGVEHLLVLEVENLLSDLHRQPLLSPECPAVAGPGPKTMGPAGAFCKRYLYMGSAQPSPKRQEATTWLPPECCWKMGYSVTELARALKLSLAWATLTMARGASYLLRPPF